MAFEVGAVFRARAIEDPGRVGVEGVMPHAIRVALSPVNVMGAAKRATANPNAGTPEGGAEGTEAIPLQGPRLTITGEITPEMVLEMTRVMDKPTRLQLRLELHRTLAHLPIMQ